MNTHQPMLNSAPGNLDTETADSEFITVDACGISWDLCVICRVKTPYRSSTAGKIALVI